MRFLELLILFSILFAVISQQRGFEEEGGLGDENERRYVEDQTGDEEDDESYGSTEKSTGNVYGKHEKKGKYSRCKVSKIRSKRRGWRYCKNGKKYKYIKFCSGRCRHGSRCKARKYRTRCIYKRRRRKGKNTVVVYRRIKEPVGCVCRQKCKPC